MTPAVLVGLSHLALGMLVQCENYFAFLRPRSEPITSAGAAFLARTAVLQWQYIIGGAILTAWAWMLWRWSGGRVVAVLTATLVNLYLLLDQIVFSVFLEHIHRSMSDEPLPSVGILLDSIRAEIGRLTSFNLAVLLAITTVLLVPFLRDRATDAVARSARRVWSMPSARWLAAAYLAASVIAPMTLNNDGVEMHPVWTIAQTPQRPDFADTASATATQDYALRFGEVSETKSHQEDLSRAWKRLAGQRHNVVFVLLESVGAEQLLGTGKPRADRAPVLARLWEEAVTFDSIYVTHPSTQASLMLLHTGGQSITWGVMDPALSQPYRGVRLADEFRAAGYRTGFFTAGDLNYAHTIDDIQGAGYDLVLHAGSLSAAERQRWALNSWGVDEAVMFSRAKQWIAEAADKKQPFFFETLTLVTHHPYTLPGEALRSGDDADAEARYGQALTYTDRQLGLLLESLAARGILEDTLIAIVGDHGEGFGRVHAGGRAHGRQIYEETVRSYLMLAAPGSHAAPLVSHRIGTMGDVGATLAALFDRPQLGNGQNLFSADYRPRLAYFHTRHEPVRWGLRDGQWKFIGGLGGDRHVELYDLAADPQEQHNLADDFPDRVAVYARLCRQWYANATPIYMAHLDGQAPAQGAITVADLSAPGPKSVLIGVDDPEFRTVEAIEPGQTAVARSEWIPYGEPKTIRYEWKSPSGRIRNVPVSLDPGASVKKVPLPMGKKPEFGDWHLSLWDGNRRLFEVSFAVRDASLVIKANAPQRPVAAARHGKGRFSR